MRSYFFFEDLGLFCVLFIFDLGMNTNIPLRLRNLLHSKKIMKVKNITKYRNFRKQKSFKKLAYCCEMIERIAGRSTEKSFVRIKSSSWLLSLVLLSLSLLLLLSWSLFFSVISIIFLTICNLLNIDIISQ